MAIARESQLPADAQSAVQTYASARPEYEACANRFRQLIEQLLDGEGIKVQAVEARTKTVDSFREKIGRAGKTYRNHLVDITDLIGLRVIVYFKSDVDRVCSLIQREFSVNNDKSVDKRASLKLNEFGYRSVHFIAKLGDARSRLPEWKTLGKYTAEFQVRTVLEHAWAAIEHGLQYKADADIPKELRRSLAQLAGTLELVDDNFSEIRRRAGEIKSDTEKKVLAGEHADLSISSDAIRSYAPRSSTLKSLLERAVANNIGSLTKMGQSSERWSSVTAAAELIGLKTINDFDNKLRTWTAIADEFFGVLRSVNQLGRDTRTDLSTPFIVLHFIASEDPELFSLPQLVEWGWSTQASARLLEVAKRWHALPK